MAFQCEMLAHAYPRVRSHVAQQFCLYLSEQQSPEKEKVLDILLKTPWKFDPFGDNQKMALNELRDVLDVREQVKKRLERRHIGATLPI